MKATENIKFDEMKKGSKECLIYLQNEAKFNSILKGMITKDTNFYDLLCVFNNKCTHWRHTLEPMLQKQEHFTSFRHFQRSFQLAKWPMIREEARMEALNCVQKEDEEIGQFYERWSDLQKLMDWDMNDRTDSFINGLKSGKIKHLISIENYSSGKRTIEQVKDHAVYLAGRLTLTEAQDPSKRRNVAAASASSTSGFNPQRSRKGGADGSKTGAVSANAVSSEKERLRVARIWAKEYGIKFACWACFGPHIKRGNYASCRTRCAFCDKDFNVVPRHYPNECYARPKKASEALAVWHRLKGERK